MSAEETQCSINATCVSVNKSRPEVSEWDGADLVSSAAALVVFPAVTVVGNVMVVLSILKEKMLKTNANYYVLSLAVADINVGLLVMPAAIYTGVYVKLTVATT